MPAFARTLVGSSIVPSVDNQAQILLPGIGVNSETAASCEQKLPEFNTRVPGTHGIPSWCRNNTVNSGIRSSFNRKMPQEES
eukprot:2150022-Rhodomonas_salina.1